MNVIPKLNGPLRPADGVCKAALPLTYGGDCPFAAQFALTQAPDPILTFQTDASLPAEGYRLTIAPQQIGIAAFGESGAFYGTQTLFRLLKETEGKLPCGVYEDAPRYRHRGFMLDVSRHFFTVEEIKKLLVQCARLKLNTFHWHLSDDQGFRIESKKFPRLNEISSWREENGKKYGGFYTQDEIRDVVAFAAERQITVIPEIDLPGHTTAIIAAYPELSCSGKPTKPETGAGIFPQILCGGDEKVYDFLYELLDEVCALFPAPYFHIGGDEAPKSEWEKCPRCQAEMQRNGLKNEEELQALFTARLADFLATKGKAVIGWNEILASGSMRSDAIAQYWTDQGAEYSAQEAPKGRKFIFSNVNAFYFDYDYPLVTLRATYGYEPHIPGGEAISPEQTLGLEAPLWTEYVETPERLETMIFPRLAALAENAWTKEKDFEDFKARVRSYEPIWAEEGVSFLPIDRADAHGTAFTERAVEAILIQLGRWGTDLSSITAERVTGMVTHMISDTYTAEEKKAIAAALIQKAGLAQ